MSLPRIVRTSAFRFTLLYVAFFAASVIVLFGIVAFSATNFMARQIDRTVANEIAEIRADTGDRGEAALQKIVALLTAKSPGIFYLLQDKDGVVLAGNMEPIHPILGIRQLHRSHHRQNARLAGGIRGQGLVMPDRSYLFVGLSSFELGEMQEVIAQAFLFGLAATVCLALAGGVLTSASLLRRIEAISDASRVIMRGDLDRRIPLGGANDELDHLAISLNAMLDRIQDLMNGLQQVSSDIAHDLRTPLTRLRQRLELAQGREQSVPQLQASIGSAIEETDAILGTFAALLSIAQIESGSRKQRFSPLDLGAILRELVEIYRPVAEEKGQMIQSCIASNLMIQGDPALLTQLYANLIENAINHTPNGTALTVSASTEGGKIETIVADRGPGIPASLRGKVLQRFFRLDASRTQAGNGLGLSLVNAIALLHDATLEMRDHQPGLACHVAYRGAFDA